MKEVLAKQVTNADKTEGDMSEKASFQSTLDNWTALCSPIKCAAVSIAIAHVLL